MATRVEAVITGKQKVNHDCYVFSFRFTGQPIHFAIGQHFRIIQVLPTHEHPEGEEVVRKYTPINPCSQTDKIDFLVKIYRPNVLPQFPHGGKYTPFLEKQEIGDKLTIEGPFGRFGYEGNGNIVIDGEQHKVKRMFFIAGGSGITPIFQTLIELAAIKEEVIELILLFANKTEEDIVLKKELESYPNRIRVHYILDQPPAHWPHLKGHITHEVLKSLCPLDDPQTLYVHCGPFGMNKLIRDLFTHSYPKSLLFKF